MKTIGKVILLAFIMTAMGQSLWAQNIFEAVEKGNMQVVRNLAADNPECLNQIDERSGGTPLHMAALRGHLEIIRFLIEKGVDPDIADRDGDSPMIWAVFGGNADAMDVLVQNGADINPPIRLGRSILHMAASNGNKAVIEYLLDKGLPIEGKCDYGNTPLLWAVMARNPDTAEALISNGATLKVINNSGHTPIFLAVGLNDASLVGLLLEKGADINEKTSSGDTPLHAAAYDGHDKMVSLLLEKGANLNAANHQSITPLDLAVMRDHQAIRSMLRSAGGRQGKNKIHSSEDTKPVGKLGSGVNGPVKVTIIYDNTVFQEGLETDWGFACLIEGTEKTILFDTGTKGDLFLRNFKALKFDSAKVDAVVISHEHGDHTGGLSAFLETNTRLPVTMPHSFSYQFVSRIKSFGAEARVVKNPVEICQDVYISGELGDRIKEQFLAINTRKGLVVVCGCAHPGIVGIVKHLKQTLNRDVYMVFGGFHLMQKTEQEMNDIMNSLKAMGVQKCGATHCTGNEQIAMFKKTFGEDFVTLGVGRVIEF